MSDQFTLTLITSVVGPVTVLYIASRIKNAKPKGDRLDKALEVYEKIMVRQQTENDELRSENSKLKAQLAKRK